MQKGKKYLHYEFLKVLRSFRHYPCYFIFGSESYLKDKILASIVKKLNVDKSNDFDFTSLYGDDTTGNEILENLEMAPFLSEYRTVIIRNFDSMNNNDKLRISEYLNNPVSTSILIIVSDKNDKRLKSFKIINKEAVVVECKAPYDFRDIQKWLSAEIRTRQIFMDQETINFFANYIEPDYLLAENELNKLILFTKGNPEISKNDIIQCVGNSRSYSIFDLQNALGDINLKKSLIVLDNLIANNESPILIINMLTSFFTTIWKVNALRDIKISDRDIENSYLPEIYHFFRKDYLKRSRNYKIDKIHKIFDYLLETDINLKSIDIKPNILLGNLIFKICK